MVEQASSADACSALEQRFREPSRVLLRRIYHLLVLLLAWLGVSRHVISFLEIPIGLAIVLAIKPHPRLAFLLMMVSIPRIRRVAGSAMASQFRHKPRSNAFPPQFDHHHSSKPHPDPDFAPFSISDYVDQRF